MSEARLPKKKIKSQQEDPLAPEPRILIPEGDDYKALCVDAKRRAFGRYGGGERAVLRFKIVDGEHAGTYLDHFLFLEDVPGFNSRYYLEWTLVNGGPPEARTRMALKRFVGKVCRVRVGTVTKDGDGDPRPTSIHYSCITKILAVEYEIAEPQEADE